jgi:hypothetical protein
MLKFFKYIIFTLLAASALFVRCTPERRMEMLLRKNPHLLKADTSDRVDSTETPGAKAEHGIHDDSIKKATKDNPIVKDSNGIITTIYHEHNHTYFKTQCPPGKKYNHYRTVTRTITTTKNDSGRLTIRDYIFVFLTVLVALLVYSFIHNLFLRKW